MYRSYPFYGQQLALHARCDWNVIQGDGTNAAYDDTIISIHVLQPNGTTQEFVLGFQNDGTPPAPADVSIDVSGFTQPIDFKNAIRGVLTVVQPNLPTPLIIVPDVITDGLFTVFQPFPGPLGNTVISPSPALETAIQINGVTDYDTIDPLFYNGAELVPLRFGRNYGFVPSAETVQSQPAQG